MMEMALPPCALPPRKPRNLLVTRRKTSGKGYCNSSVRNQVGNRPAGVITIEGL